MPASPNDLSAPTPASPNEKQLPGIFDLLLYSLTLTKRYRHELYGFTGYLLFPLIFSFGIQGLSGTIGAVATFIVNILFVMMLCWIIAAIMTTVSYRTAHPEKNPDPRSIGAHALKTLNPFILVCILSGIIQSAGYILLIIPGIVASVLLTFSIQEVVISGQGPLSALAASRARVQPQFFGILWRLIAIMGSSLLLYTVISIGCLFFGSTLTNTPIESLLTQPPLWFETIAALIQLSLLPFIITAHTILYLSSNPDSASKTR